MRMGAAIGPAALVLLAGPAIAQEADEPGLKFVLEETVTLGKVVEVGKTVRGERRIIPITGGHFEGPAIKGEVMPGGWDWQLGTAGGCFRLHADYMIRTDDGVVINVVNQGTTCRDLAKPGERMITVPVFEAPLGRFLAGLAKPVVVRSFGAKPVRLRG